MSGLTYIPRATQLPAVASYYTCSIQSGPMIPLVWLVHALSVHYRDSRIVKGHRLPSTTSYSELAPEEISKNLVSISGDPAELPDATDCVPGVGLPR